MKRKRSLTYSAEEKIGTQPRGGKGQQAGMPAGKRSRVGSTEHGSPVGIAGISGFRG